MQHFSENCWKKRLAKTVFPGEKGKWPENGRNGEKGKRNRMPGKGKRQSSRSEIGAQVTKDTASAIDKFTKNSEQLGVDYEDFRASAEERLEELAGEKQEAMFFRRLRVRTDFVLTSIFFLTFDKHFLKISTIFGAKSHEA